MLIIQQINLLINNFYKKAASKGKLILYPAILRKFILFTFSLKFFKLSTLVGGTYSFFEKNVYNFSISSWQASPSLLQLTQFRTESFSRAGISSVSVSCRPKLANNSEDIFFCSFFISFFSR